MALETDVGALAAARADGAIVIDVREPEEYVEGHVPGAWLIPLAELPTRAGELPRTERVHVICASGNRSAWAAMWLSRAGWDAVSVAGGTAAWQQAGHPVVTGVRADVA